MLWCRYGNWEYHYVGLPVFGAWGGGWGGYGPNYWCNSYNPGAPSRSRWFTHCHRQPEIQKSGPIIQLSTQGWCQELQDSSAVRMQLCCKGLCMRQNAMHGMKGSCIPHLTCTSLGSMHMQVGRHPGNPSCIYPFKRLAELSRMMCGYCNAAMALEQSSLRRVRHDLS